MSDEELPEGLQQRPVNRNEWDFPTAWLLGTRLVSSLVDIAISAVFDFDPRDWMTASIVELDQELPRDRDEHGEECVWIDYLADSGDSPRLVYQLAYLLQQERLQVHGRDAKGARRLLPTALPRGSLLVFGGDTAYPIATRRRLLERVRAPFIWARREVLGKKPDNTPLLGIPGNHDYYNALAGYERMFHAGRKVEEDITRRVDLPGYEMRQQASYFAAKLPFGWQFWGLDIETKPIDDMQKAYFEAALKDADFKCNLIVATSKPAVVGHALSRALPKEIGPSFAALGLSPAFANLGQLDSAWLRLDLSGDTHLYERYWGTDIETKFGEVATKHTLPGERGFPATDRWTTLETNPAVGNDTSPQAPTVQRANYASVVSGLGGAFHHPSQVRERTKPADVITPRAAWPGGGESDRAIGDRLLRPRKLFQAGAVGVIGMIIAVTTYSNTKDLTILDVPFELPGCSLAPLHHLCRVVAIAATIVVLGAIMFGAIQCGKWLHQPVQSLMTPRPWSRGWLTYKLASIRVVKWGLRWAGINWRNFWGVLITFWAWISTIAAIAGVWWALSACRVLPDAADGHVHTYVILVIVGFFMIGLAMVKLGSRSLWLLPFGLVLGALTACLIVWTPYAWIRIWESDRRYLVLSFPAYWLLRHFLWRVLVNLRTTARRCFSLLGYALVIAVYVGIPLFGVRHGSLDHSELCRWFSLVPAAYLSCLWMGWYFYICLQWNAHGNEVGGAARVVSFAEFLRIKLTANRAEVYVIGAEGPMNPKRSRLHFCSPLDQKEEAPRAHLIDHFVIERNS